MTSTLRITGTLIRKDVLSLLPLILLTTLIQVLDLLVEKLDVLSLLAAFMPYVVLLSSFALILSVFQLDAPASLVDDWLCRPIPKSALLFAKLSVVLTTLYGSRVLGTLGIDLYLGYSLAESLLDAFLLQEKYALFVLPILIMIALVTTTLVQGMGALLGLFVVVFLIPTPLISPPGPLEPGIGEALGETGLGWMATAPGKLVLLVLLGVCMLVVFRFRNILLGRILLVTSTAVTVLLAILPMYVVPWDLLYRTQSFMTGRAEESAPAAAETFSLHADSACFPALPPQALNNDATYLAASQYMGLSNWTEEQLEAAGPGGVSFITRVAPRGLPRDWRAQASYVAATYFDGNGASIALRPARYMTSRNSGSSTQTYTHQWLLPQAELDKLAKARQPHLELTYSFTLLRPRSFELAADGVRHKLAGLGWCAATLESRGNLITVDCFSADSQPALVSAELLGIEASRVDSTPPDYAPGLIRLFTSRRFEIELDSASLLQTPAVTLTAWHNAGMLQSSVQRRGILGDELDTCPLPAATAAFTQQLSNWSDESPHLSSYIGVDEGVQLELLDWGGTGTPLLLLSGLGATAHTWDTIAPKLIADFRVLALSRRGVGGSSRPEFGYDTPTLARDVVRVLDALALDKAVIVGSSVAGDEMTWLGADYPDRIAALVYLDAAYDRSREVPDDQPAYATLLPPGPPIRPEELRSYETLLQWFERTATYPLPEGELIAAYNFSNRYLAGAPAFDMRLLGAVAAAIEAPRYRDIKVPALALYATKVRWEDDIKPWYDRSDAEVMDAVRGNFELNTQNQRYSIEQFRAEVPGAEVIEIPGAAHVMFLSHEAEVIAQIRRFVAERVGKPTGREQ
jgi:pimeloyl-ACP methyl ester carboxylesterase